MREAHTGTDGVLEPLSHIVNTSMEALTHTKETRVILCSRMMLVVTKDEDASCLNVADPRPRDAR